MENFYLTKEQLDFALTNCMEETLQVLSNEGVITKEYKENFMKNRVAISVRHIPLWKKILKAANIKYDEETANTQLNIMIFERK